MSDRKFELTRRKALAGLATVGAAGAGAGLGTSALFNDTESFNNNSITAGTLDMTVDAEVVAANTEYEDAVGDITYDVTADGAAETGLTLSDFKPGDWVIVCYDISIGENPGYVLVQANNLESDENGFEEPEPEDGDSDGEGELDDKLLATVWDDFTGDQSSRGQLETLDIVTNNAASSFPDSSSTNHAWDSNRSEGGEVNDDIHYTSLRETYEEWFANGFLLGPGPDSDASIIGSGDDAKTVYLLLEVPKEVGNEIQGDSVSFDLEWRAEQVRNNDNPLQPLVLTGDSPQGQGAGFGNPWDTTSNLAHTGSGAWGTVDHTNSGTGNAKDTDSDSDLDEYKQGFYFGAQFSSFNRLPAFTISQIDEISYWLREPTSLQGNDIYLLIYTQPEGDGNDGAGWYDSRLVALPSNANQPGGSPNFTPGQWNKFSTKNNASNTLTWDDTGHKSGNSVGGPNLPTLSDLKTGAIDWNNYDSSPTESDSDPDVIDYTNQTVKALSLQTNSTSPGLEAWIDDVFVRLTNGEELVLDLEP